MTDLKHAFNYLCSIRDSIAASDKFFLFLDYDGTLAHITSKPEDAKPLPRLIRLFEKFNSKKTVINIVSGRDIKNLCKLLNKVDISGINLIGSHGSEIIFASSGGQIKQTGNFTSKESEAIRYLKDKVALYSSEIKNSRIEEKPYSFALHYRDTPAKELYKVDEIIDFLQKEQKKYSFKYIVMKKVIEVMPEKQSKGTAIQRVLDMYGSRAESKKKCLKYFIVCIGDDVTDEDLFEANKSGVNIRVQKESKKINTCAEYYLTDPDEVILFLEQLLT